VQEVGFPTRSEVEGGRRPVCTSAARKIGVPLARARDGVPQEGLVTLLCAERRKMLCSSGGRCGRERPAEEGAGRRGFIAGCRLGEPSPLSGNGLGLMSGGVCCGMRRRRRGMSILARRDWLKLKNLLKTSRESVDLRSCCLQSLFGECSSV
jgi:hypothetical protein